MTFSGDESSWRVYSQPIKQGDRIIGWLQAAHELSLVDETLANMRYQLLLGLPLVLLLAGVVGLFLADGALRPIAAITPNGDEAPVLSERINLTDMLHATADFMQSLAEEKRQTISLDVPRELILHGNEDNLVRLFLNLVDNAIKYTLADGQIYGMTRTHAIMSHNRFACRCHRNAYNMRQKIIMTA